MEIGWTRVNNQLSKMEDNSSCNTSFNEYPTGTDENPKKKIKLDPNFKDNGKLSQSYYKKYKTSSSSENSEETFNIDHEEFEKMHPNMAKIPEYTLTDRKTGKTFFHYKPKK